MALEAFVNGKKEKSAGKSGDTLRFEVELALPTDDSTNEFSYARLVADALGKRHALQPELGPPSEEPGDKIGAIARQLEEKYAPKSRKRLVHESDLIDKGDGYDVTDPFVDDTELYEDYVPPHVETQFGGFYVNTGELEFRKAEGVDEDDFDFRRKKPKLKKHPSHATPQAILANKKLKKAKQHVASQKTPKAAKSIKMILPTPGASPHGKKISKPHKKVLPSTSGMPGGSLHSALLSTTASSLQTATCTPTPTVPISIGSVSLNVPLFDPNSTSSTGQSSLTNQVQAAVQKLSLPEEPPAPTTAPKPPPVLPDGLPADLHGKIRDLEECVAKVQRMEGKVSNKTRESYSEQVADIEICCRKVALKIRTAVMEYLSAKLGVSKATLFKRTKDVLRKREEMSLQQPLQRLRDAVEASMPDQLTQYEEEVRTRTESTSSLSDKDVKMETEEDNRTDDAFEDSQLPSQHDAKAKRPPRRKYKWSEETRKLLCDVVRVKVETAEVINRISRGNPEELITQFLEEKVKPVWPKSWMQKSTLYKVSEPAHKHFTNPGPRKAKKEKLPTVKVEPNAVPQTPPPSAVSQIVRTPPRPTITPATSGSPTKVERPPPQPKVSTTKVITQSALGRAGTSAQTKPVTVVAGASPIDGKTTYGVKKPVSATRSPAQPSGQLKQTSLQSTVISSSLPSVLAKVRPNSTAGGHFVVTEPPKPSTKATTTYVPQNIVSFLASANFDKLMNVHSSVQTTSVPKTTIGRSSKPVPSQAKPAIIRQLKSASELPRHSYTTTGVSICTGVPSHSSSRMSVAQSQVSSVSMKTNVRTVMPATQIKPAEMPANTSILPPPGGKQTITPFPSSSSSVSPYPQVIPPSTKSLPSPPRVRSPKHHQQHKSLTGKATTSPKCHQEGMVSLVSTSASHLVRSLSPSLPSGSSTARTSPPITHTRTQSSSHSVSVVKRTSPLTLPTASPSPVLSSLPVASSPGTPPLVKSPVDQIIQEHCYGGHSPAQLLTHPVPWTLGDTPVAQEHLLIATPSALPWTLGDTPVAQEHLLIATPPALQQRHLSSVEGSPHLLLPVCTHNHTGSSGPSLYTVPSSHVTLRLTQSNDGTSTTIWQPPR